jgi:23S rRNA A2030 N6-methylase RlmJ
VSIDYEKYSSIVHDLSSRYFNHLHSCCLCIFYPFDAGNYSVRTFPKLIDLYAREVVFCNLDISWEDWCKQKEVSPITAIMPMQEFDDKLDRELAVLKEKLKAGRIEGKKE